MYNNKKAFFVFTGFCVCLSIVLLYSQAIGQEGGQLSHYYSIQIKPGMGGEFEKLMKSELNPALCKGGVQQMSVWKTGIFGTAGHYIITQPVESIAQYDQPNPLLKALGEKKFMELIAKLQKLVRSNDMCLVMMRPDLGIDVPADYEPKLVIQVGIEVAPGRNAEYEKGIKEVMEIVKKTNAKGVYAAKVGLGGNPNEYHAVVLLDSFSDMDRYAKAFSAGMAKASLTPMSGVITRMEYKVYSYLPELSIRPPTP